MTTLAGIIRRQRGADTDHIRDLITKEAPRSQPRRHKDQQQHQHADGMSAPPAAEIPAPPVYVFPTAERLLLLTKRTASIGVRIVLAANITFVHIHPPNFQWFSILLYIIPNRYHSVNACLQG